MKFIIIYFAFILLLSQLAFSQGETEKASISGIVKDKSTQSPIRGITVRIVGTNLGGFTKPEGTFNITNIPVGVYAVQFSGVGYETYVVSNVIVANGMPSKIVVELVQKIIELEGTEVRSSYFEKRIQTVTSTQSFNAEDIRRAPGVQEDVIRATALLPGVGVTAAGRNDLIVRGGAPFENLFLVDGIEVPNINHFGSQGSTGGPLSLINIDFVRNVEFSSGGFGSRYGDKTSSLTSITLKEGNDEMFGGTATLSATGIGIAAEGPLGNSGNYFFSARRSYLDFIFKAAGFGFIPQYWDLQGKINYNLNRENTLSYLFVGALDDVTLNNEDLDKRYDNSQFAVPEQKQYFTGLKWKTLFGNGFATFTLGRTYTNFNTTQRDTLENIIFQNLSQEGENSLNADFEFMLSPQLELNFGNTIKFASSLDYNIVIPDSLRLDQNGIGRPLSVDTTFNALKNSTYASLTTGLGNFKLTFGGRMDYYGFLSDKFFFSPRFSSSFQINDISAIIFSAGRFYQSPSYIWLLGGSEKIPSPFSADQIVLGYEHTPLEDVKVQVETYYKWYNNYPARVYRPQAVLAPSGFDDISSDIPFGLEPLMSSGTGVSRGVEIFIQKKFSDIPLYGLLSLTLSETKFTSIEGKERTGAYDSRFITNFSLGYRFDSEWELSGKFRFATGLPTTPFSEDKSGRLDYTKYNEGGRLPNFHSLDMRLDKRWYFSSVTLITYIDIQNIYGRKNASDIRWDYRTSKPILNESIGVLPSIGVILGW